MQYHKQGWLPRVQDRSKALRRLSHQSTLHAFRRLRKDGTAAHLEGAFFLAGFPGFFSLYAPEIQLLFDALKGGFDSL